MAELTESVRNGLLRRVDWRFLLPDPLPGRAVCFAGGGLRRAVELISESTLEPAAAAGSDLAVASDPDGDTLRAAWAALREGGSCYTEWRWRPGRDWRSVRGTMEAAGFEQVRCFWAWPSREHCEAWLPLGSDAAFEYFFDVHRASRSPLRRVLHAAQHRLARLRYGTGLQLPVCAVARKPRTSAGAAAGSDQPALLEEHADGDPASWLLMTGGRRSENKVIALSFGPAARTPRTVVKISRVRESAPGLANEAAVLQALERSHPAGIAGIPRILSCRHHRSLVAVAETPCIGRPLWSVLRRSNYGELAMLATNWLVDLAQASRSRPALPGSGGPIEPALADFERDFGDVVDPGMLRETTDALRALGPLPTVCEQRDCSPWNIFISRDRRPLVLDWESSVLDGLPAVDLVYFLSYLGFYVHRAMRSGRYREVYRAGLDPATPTGKIHRDCLAHYAARTGLDPGLIEPLRLLTWVIHSRSEYRHLRADAGRAPTREKLRRSLFLALWEEQVTHMRGRPLP